MPVSLVERANEILATLEEKNGSDKLTTNIKKLNTQQFQLNIFDGLAEDLKRIRELLDATEINTLTPVEALMKLNEMKSILNFHK
jgi:DNA mismatch repair protein MutS